MIVELIGGPLDGEVRNIGNDREWRIVRPSARTVVGDERQISDPVPVEYGLYIARTHAPGFPLSELYWWGWHS